MNFSIQRPAVFFLLLLLIPALVVSFIRYKKIISVCGKKKSLIFSFTTKTLFAILSYVFMVFACAGISWGSRTVPVQKANRSVSFIFDISYSMEARDAPQGMTRLASAAEYASSLLDHLEGVPVSLVLAKGDGVVAIPLTEDQSALRLLLKSLSPKLLTSVGSSLGSGIRAAIRSVPEQMSSSCDLWLFTDGDETDESLLPALNEAAKYGVPVTIIGFGSERETEVLSGDGVRKVKTALRSEKLQRLTQSVNSFTPVRFVDASSVGSASLILRRFNEQNASTVTSYETKDAPRYRLFIGLSILSFILSILLSELRLKPVKKTILETLLVFSAFTFFSCSGKFSDGKLILSGSLEWNGHDYQHAVADFLTAAQNAENREDEKTKQYALYALASTYLMQGELIASEERFSQIEGDCSDELKFAIFYNRGIIAHRSGDYEKAVSCFREALLVDPANVDAKINLELSQGEVSVKSNSEEQQLESVSVSDDEEALQNALYSILRESELSQWKNRMQESDKDALDY